jgi:hypothetical protein
MSDASVRVYVNERGVSVPAGATALDAVRALLPDDAAAIEAGTRRLTDSRGLPVSAADVLVNGAIYRVVSARSALGEGTTDADERTA